MLRALALGVVCAVAFAAVPALASDHGKTEAKKTEHKAEAHKSDAAAKAAPAKAAPKKGH